VAEFCLLARPAKANPRSRPIRAGDKSLGVGSESSVRFLMGGIPECVLFGDEGDQAPIFAISPFSVPVVG
jgi:hypothetical protein